MKNVFHISLLSATKAYLVNCINKNDLCYGEDSTVQQMFLIIPNSLEVTQ